MLQNTIQLESNCERNILKLSIDTSDVLKQTICKIESRRAPTPNDNIQYVDCDKMSKKSLFLVLQRKAADDNKDNYVSVEVN